MSITIKDVAKQANVSVATVSRILNNLPGYSDETQQRVKKVIKELGYQPNAVARGLINRKTKTIGVLVPNVSDLFASEVLAGKEALMFIHFLLEKENSQYYIQEQNSFSAVKNVLQNDEALKELNPYFVQQKITSFPEHYFPASMQAANLVQDFLIKGEVKPFLSKLDDEWNKVKARE
ncbi:LacI family DNA-binding transcriptional regulator [Peribacillus simplex]|uniref:LacI family DNA-binding transcriptional regulator n=1 Tax=Peribacillus simplex TaxID=1478 RepID=UPI002E241677|nr:LacI family DNA-binding transcriptional regulator [Peribacillus simplex]